MRKGVALLPEKYNMSSLAHIYTRIPAWAIKIWIKIKLESIFEGTSKQRGRGIVVESWWEQRRVRKKSESPSPTDCITGSVLGQQIDIVLHIIELENYCTILL